MRAIVVRSIRAVVRHAIFRFRYNAVRSTIWIDTFPKVMRLCFPQVKWEDVRQDGLTRLPNGSEIWWGGLDEKERTEKILGQEHAGIFFNECSQIPYQSVTLALTRLAQKSPLKNRAYYDLNPTGTRHWTNRLFFERRDPEDGSRPLAAPQDYAAMFMNPEDNAANIDADYLESLRRMPERLRRRFYEGRYVAEMDNALWTLDSIERTRIEVAPPNLRRVVVGVDPSGCSGPEDERSDEVGIVVGGIDDDGKLYLLADRSGRYSPEQWGRVAINAMREFRADRIVGESNFGGDMVRSVIQTADRNAPYFHVSASRGKVQRAEPVAALYEQGRVFHVGRHERLEDQLLSFTTAGYIGERSPDRADAWVWVASELMEAPDSIFEFFRQRAVSIEADRRAKKEDLAHAS